MGSVAAAQGPAQAAAAPTPAGRPPQPRPRPTARPNALVQGPARVRNSARPLLLPLCAVSERPLHLSNEVVRARPFSVTDVAAAPPSLDFAVDCALRIWTPAQDVPKTAHAMYSLKAAMKWDEEVFGLEYDLDLFNIFAAPDFNMVQWKTRV